MYTGHEAFRSSVQCTGQTFILRLIIVSIFQSGRYDGGDAVTFQDDNPLVDHCVVRRRGCAGKEGKGVEGFWIVSDYRLWKWRAHVTRLPLDTLRQRTRQRYTVYRIANPWSTNEAITISTEYERRIAGK